MAGIPHHAADGYIARLIRAGQKVAVCEQMEAPAKGKKLVRREVVRVVTPGTHHRHAVPGRGREQLPPRRCIATPGGASAPPSSTSPPATSGWGSEDGAGAALLEAALLRRPAELLVARERRRAMARARAKRSACAVTTRGAGVVRAAARARDGSSRTSAGHGARRLRRGRR